MAISRRIITRNQIVGSHIRVAEAPVGAPTCTRVIDLDGTRYRCKRAVRSFDRQHDGIHDAFCEHSDSGAVRW